MSSPARRHEAGEIPNRTLGSCYVLQQRLQPRACGASPVLPTGNLDRSSARINLSGHERVTSLFGHQGPVGTQGVVADMELCQTRTGVLGIFI